MKKRLSLSSKILTTFSLVIFLFFGQKGISTVFAATGINETINFQGKLVDNNSLNVSNSTYTVVFTLYDASSGGTQLWQETQSVTTTDGVFRVALNSVNADWDAVNFNTDNLYLGIKVGADAEMTPRIRFTAVPYAMNAKTASSATNVKWSGLQAPTANLSLSMASNTSTFTYGATTGSSNLFTLTDTASNTGTGYLLNLATNTSSTLKPLRISVNNGGTEALMVDASGNVGIGTTSVTSGAKVDINGNLYFSNSAPVVDFYSAVPGTYSLDRSSTTLTLKSGSVLDLKGSTWVRMYTGNTERIRIDANGNIGMGTTSPLRTLDLSGSIRTTGKATAVLTGTIDPAASTTVTGAGTAFLTELVIGDRITVSGETRTVTAIASNTSLTIDSPFTDNANDTSPDVLYAQNIARNSSGSVNFVIQDSGNVGIGTTSPSTALTVNGTVRATAFTAHNGSGQNLISYDGSANVNIGSSSLYGGITFLPGSAEKMRLTSAGNLGIGDSTPASLFTVGNGDLFQINSSGNVGLFTNPSSSFALNVGPTSTVTSGTIISGRFVPTASPASNSTASYRAGFFQQETNSAFDISGTVMGLNASALKSGAGADTEYNGLSASVVGNAGTITTGRNTYQVIAGGGSITTARAVEARIQNTGAGTIGTASTFYVRSPVNSGGGTLTTNYGLYIEDLNVAGTNYALYTNAGLNRLGDQLSIAGSADRIQLIVKGNATQTTNLQEWQNSSGTPLVSISGTGNLNIAGLTASKAVFTDSSKNLTTTGTVGSDQGGTGFSTYATGDLIYASGTNTLAKLAAGTEGQVLTIASGVPTWATGGGSSSWSSLTAPSGALTLSLAGNTSTFNYTGTNAPVFTLNSSGAVTSGNAGGLDINVSSTSTSVPAMTITNAGTSHALRINDDGSTTDSSPFIISPSGNVGIGTTSAIQALHVIGKGAFGDSLSTTRLNSGTGTARSFSLIDQNAVMRVWRFAASGDPAIEFVSGDNTGSPTTDFTDGVNNTHNVWWDIITSKSTSGGEGMAFRRRTGGTGPTSMMTIAATGNIGIGASPSTARLVIQGSGADDSTVALRVTDSGGSNPLFYIRDNGNVAIGTSSPTAKFDVLGTTINAQSSNFIGTANFGGSITKDDANNRTFAGVQIKPTLNTGGSNANTTYNILNIDTTNTAITGLTTNLIKASYGGTQAFLVTSAGNLTLAGTTTLNSQTYTWPASAGSNGYALTTNGSGTLSWSAVTTGTVTGTGTQNYLTKWNSGGTGIQDSLLYDNGTNVGIGTTTVSAKLHILATTEQLRLGYDASNYSSFTVNSTGDLTIAPSGGDTSITGTLGVSGATTLSSTLAVTGATSLNGAVNLGDATGDDITFNGRVASNIVPKTDDTYDLGTSSLRWRDAYLGPSSLHLVSNTTETVTARDWKIGIDETNGSTDGNFRIMEGATQYLTINNNGNVGIGTPNPGNAFEIAKTSPTFSLYDDSEGVGLNIINSGLVAGMYYGSGGSLGSLEFDTNTSLSGTTLNFRTNSSTRMNIQADGNIGIGTSSPAHFVHIVGPNAAGSADAINALTVVGGTGGEGALGGAITLTGGTGGADPMVAGKGGSIRLTAGNGGNTSTGGFIGGHGGDIILTPGTGGTGLGGSGDTGYVGINSVSPARTLDVGGTGRFSNTLTLSSGLTLTTGALNMTSSSGAVGLTLSSSTTAFNVNSGLFNIDTTNSRVGVGTTAPTLKFDVISGASSRTARFSNTTTHGEIEIDTPTNFNSGVILKENNSDKFGLFYNSNVSSGNRSADTFELYSFTSSNPIIRVHQSASLSLAIDSAGNVGIGTSTTSLAKFTVNGLIRSQDSTTAGFQFVDRISSDLWQWYGSGSGSAGTAHLYNGAANIFSITEGGNVGILDATPTEGTLVVGSSGGGTIYASFSTANTERLCWDASGASLITDCTGTPGDYAEQYGSNGDLIAGDIVMIDGSKPIQHVEVDGRKGTKAWVVKSTTAYDKKVIGIVSTDPNEVIGQNFTDAENPVPVALNGRVPVNISTSSQSIQAGDFITASADPGKGMKALKAGYMVGRALESWNASSGNASIMVYVNNTYADPESILSQLALNSNGELSISSYENSISTINTNLSTQLSQLSTLNTNVLGLSTQTSSQSGTLATLETEITNMKSQMTSITATLANLTNRVDANTAAISSHSAQLADVIARLETIQSEGTTSGTLNQIEERVAFLENAVLGGSGSAVLGASSSGSFNPDTQATLSGLLVTGKTNLNDLGVVGSMNVGLISVDGLNSSVEALGSSLKLQPSASGTVEVMANKVEITQTGDIKIKEGNIEIQDGIIKANDKIRGVETLSAGQTSITVTKAWSDAPITITANPSYDSYVWISNITSTGFTINVKNAPSTDEKIYWNALW